MFRGMCVIFLKKVIILWKCQAITALKSCGYGNEVRIWRSFKWIKVFIVNKLDLDLHESWWPAADFGETNKQTNTFFLKLCFIYVYTQLNIKDASSAHSRASCRAFWNTHLRMQSVVQVLLPFLSRLDTSIYDFLHYTFNTFKYRLAFKLNNAS